MVLSMLSHFFIDLGENITYNLSWANRAIVQYFPVPNANFFHHFSILSVIFKISCKRAAMDPATSISHSFRFLGKISSKIFIQQFFFIFLNQWPNFSTVQTLSAVHLAQAMFSPQFFFFMLCLLFKNLNTKQHHHNCFSLNYSSDIVNQFRIIRSINKLNFFRTISLIFSSLDKACEAIPMYAEYPTRTTIRDLSWIQGWNSCSEKATLLSTVCENDQLQVVFVEILYSKARRHHRKRWLPHTYIHTLYSS